MPFTTRARARGSGPPAMGPLVVSQSNTRYFARPDGQTVLLAGSHTWANLKDSGQTDPPPAFDYAAYLDVLVAHGHNAFRLWPWEQDWKTAEIAGAYWFTPSLYLRPGPGTALDGKPKYDVTQFNPAYFARLRARVEAARARGIYVIVCLFNGWSVEPKGPGLDNPWHGHPFHAANNVNGINGDPSSVGHGRATHTLAIPAITAVQTAYVEAVIDAVNDLDNVLYEISNESDPASVAWQYALIDHIHAYESTKPYQHPVGMTVPWPGGTNQSCVASPAEWVSLNGDLENPVAADGTKVILADTDHLCGVCGSVAWVWKTLCRGQQPLLMDGYDGAAIGLGAADYDAEDPTWPAIRANMGYARALAERLPLASMTPQNGLASTGYCLATNSAPTPVYVVYLAGETTVTVDLSAVSGSISVAWLSTADGAITPAAPTTGGASRQFARPTADQTVLLLGVS